MTEEQQALQYLSSLPKGEIDQMNVRRRKGTRPLHSLDEEDKEPTESVRESYKIEPNLPLTSEEGQERLDRWNLSRQCDAVRGVVHKEQNVGKVKASRKARWQVEKARNEKFRRMEHAN